MHYELNLYTYVLCLGHVFMYSFCQWSAQIMNIFVFNSTLITGQLQWWWAYGLFPVKFLVQFFSHNGSSINVSEWLPDYCQGSREMQDGVGSKRQSWLSKLLYSDEQQKVERDLKVFGSTLPILSKTVSKNFMYPELMKIGLKNKSQNSRNWSMTNLLY